MGAFVITLLLSRGFRRAFGKDVRGSILAFLLSLGICLALGSYGYSTDTLSPLQVLPWVALGYGKFCLAFLVIDIDKAIRLRSDPEYETKAGLLRYSPTPALILAIAIVAAGAYASFLLPEPTSAITSTSASTWSPTASEDGLFKVQMPGQPQHSSSDIPNPTGRPPIRLYSWDVETDDGLYSVQYLRFTDEHIDPSATSDRVLERARDGMLKNASGRLLEEDRAPFQGWPSLALKASFPNGSDSVVGRARLIVAGRTQYIVAAFGATEENATRFLSSFTITGASDSFRLPVRDSNPY